MFNRKSKFFTIFIVVLVNFLGATIVQPTLPLYTKRHFGAPDHVIPLLMTAYFAAQFVAAPFLGRLSDRYGRLPVLILSQIGTVLSFLLMAFAGNLQLLFFARVLDGLTGGNVIVAQAYITDIAPPQQRTKALGLVFAAFGVGYTFGPALGGILSVFGERTPFFVGALLSLAAVVLIWLMLDESLTPEERLARRERHVTLNVRDIIANPSFVLILTCAFFAQFSMALFNSTFPLYGEEVVFRGFDERYVGLGVGILLGTIGVAQVLTQLVVIQRVVARFGERRTVVIGTLLRAFGLIALIILASPFLIGPIAFVAFALGAGIMMPSLQSLTTTTVSEDISGGALGVYGSFASLGIIFGSGISGTLYTLNPAMPYLTGAIIYALITIPALMLLRRDSGRLLVSKRGAAA